ncbi:MAG: TonB-dependent receptor [Gammaproteobacteria bacterium]
MSVMGRFIALFSLLACIQLEASQSILDEIVVTAVKESQSMREVNTTIGSLDEAELSDIQHTHINEALHRIAGTWISRGNGQEHLTAIRSPVLTGAGSCGAFLMMQDGISLRAPGFCNVNELFESTSELAGRIEVQKGPGSDIYGSNALHGAVNVITPIPVADLRRIRLQAGPDEYLRAKLSASSASTRIDISGTTDGGFKDDSGFDQQKLLLKHLGELADLGTTTTFSYTNLNQETAGFVQGDEAYKDAGLRRDNPNPEAYRDARSFRLLTRLERDTGTSSVAITPYLRSSRMEFLQHFLPGQAIEENGHDSIGLQTLWTGLEGKLHVGAEIDYTRGFLEEFQPTATRGPAFLVATIPAGQHYDYDVDALSLGLFARYRQDLTDDLSLTWGVRLQQTEYDYYNLILDGITRDDVTACGFGGCRFNRPADREDSFTDISPRLGFIYNIGADRQLYGSVSRGFRAPQATELYRLQAGQDVARIDSVELDALELGYRAAAERFSYAVAIYAMQKDNFIFRDTSRQNVDNGETQHHGIELSLNADLSDTLAASLAFSWAEHEYANDPQLSATPLDGNEIDTAPSTLGAARLHWQTHEDLNVELEWVHVGSYYQDPQNQHEYEGHDLLHLRTHWRLSERTLLSARIMNLTDEDYAERADYGFGNDRYFIGTPLSVFLGIQLDL